MRRLLLALALLTLLTACKPEPPPIVSNDKSDGARPVQVFCQDALEGYPVDAVQPDGFVSLNGFRFNCEAGATGILYWSGGRKVWVEAEANPPAPCPVSPCDPGYEKFGESMEWSDVASDDDNPERTPDESWQLVVKLVRRAS